jgi:hypothetical protein
MGSSLFCPTTPSAYSIQTYFPLLLKHYRTHKNQNDRRTAGTKSASRKRRDIDVGEKKGQDKPNNPVRRQWTYIKLEPEREKERTVKKIWNKYTVTSLIAPFISSSILDKLRDKRKIIISFTTDPSITCNQVPLVRTFCPFASADEKHSNVIA